MPVPAGSRLDPEATRARIVAAAQELFYERGVHAVGVNEIAERSGASKLSIYRYFDSKNGLVEAVLDARSQHVRDWITRRTATAAPGRDRVLALFDLLLSWYGEADYRGCIVVNTAIDTRDGTPDVRALVRGHLAWYRQFLAEQLDTAGVGDSELLARRLLILIEGATTITAMERDPLAGLDARAAADVLIDAALR